MHPKTKKNIARGGLFMVCTAILFQLLDCKGDMTNQNNTSPDPKIEEKKAPEKKPEAERKIPSKPLIA